MSKTITLTITAVLFVAMIIVVFVYTPRAPEQDTIADKIVDKTDATFVWSYQNYEKEFIPRAIISLTAQYTDGTIEKKIIEDIDGGCETYNDKDADAYTKSDMIICYYAGFGRYYKVVETLTGYDVKRKEFEEGSPDYNPPILPFETIATF